MPILSSGEYVPGPPSRTQSASEQVPDAWMREAQLTEAAQRAEMALHEAELAGDPVALARAQRVYQMAEARRIAASDLSASLEDEIQPVIPRSRR